MTTSSRTKKNTKSKKKNAKNEENCPEITEISEKKFQEYLLHPAEEVFGKCFPLYMIFSSKEDRGPLFRRLFWLSFGYGCLLS